MSSLVDYAEDELQRIGMGKDTTDPMNKAMHDHIIHMVKEFSGEGHSGFSANYAIGILMKLLNYEVLSPLTGADDEWMAVDDSLASVDMMYQNKRCFSVFKQADGRAYDLGSKVYYPKGRREETYTKGGERTYITFPYTHKVEYIEVDE